MTNPKLPALQDFTTPANFRELAKAVYHGEFTDDQVRALPPQTSYLIAKHNGFESSMELLASMSSEQYKALLDFELWDKDIFKQEALIKFAGICEQFADQYETEDNTTKDAAKGLTALAKIVREIDPKLLCLLINGLVTVTQFENPTEQPPAAHSFTPDGGHTWLTFHSEAPDEERLLGKILALLFEHSNEAFFQILATAHHATRSSMEELAYEERIGRLLDQGFPSFEYANEVFSGIDVSSFLQSSKELPSTVTSQAHVTVETTDLTLQPLGSLIQEIARHHKRDEFSEEYAAMINAAIVKYSLFDKGLDDLQPLFEFCRGAINIGLEQALALQPNATLFESYSRHGLIAIFRLGLANILELKKLAFKVKNSASSTKNNLELELVITQLTADLPAVPAFVLSEAANNQQEKESQSLFLEHIQSCNKVKALLSRNK